MNNNSDSSNPFAPATSFDFKFDVDATKPLFRSEPDTQGKLPIKESPEAHYVGFSGILTSFSEQLMNLQAKLELYKNEALKLEEFKAKLVDTAAVAKARKIKLNVGGQTFASTSSTLSKENSLLSAIVSGNFGVEPDEDGCIFVDRDPKYFPHILNYLRTTKVDSSINLQELLEEAQYYQIESLQSKIIDLAVDSVILSSKGKHHLKELFGFQPFCKLLWRGSRNGFNADSFPQLCDGKGPTFIICRSNLGFVFGGFNGCDWNVKTYSCDSSSWLYTFGPEQFSILRKFKCNGTQGIHGCTSYGSYGSPEFGPTFGGCLRGSTYWLDLHISNNMQAPDSCSATPNVYATPAEGFLSDPCNSSTLAGASKFCIQEIEVFSILN